MQTVIANIFFCELIYLVNFLISDYLINDPEHLIDKSQTYLRGVSG